WYLERAIAHFETSDENLHSLIWISPKRSPILTRCSVFKDQVHLSSLFFVSAATFIIYHSALVLVNLFLIFFFRLIYDCIAAHRYVRGTSYNLS
ncbi:hypothetical protein, partial [Paenibacillus sp. FSL R7-269]|uniref:hypothetical protein n=1 Tax=Paenibacillus sp. FSL R7-269 TaxID=1226755 RepID=UPI001F1EB1A1